MHCITQMRFQVLSTAGVMGISFLSPLNKPLIPPIFLTMAANLVYCESSSWTSLVEAPAPRATRAVRLGWRENNFAPLGLSSSGKVMGFTGQIPSGKQDFRMVMRKLSQGKEGDTFHHPVCFWPQNNYYSEARSQRDCRNYENPLKIRSVRDQS